MGIRTVAITGASAGIGRATALEFARRGCDVALLARDPERLDAAAAEVRACGMRALPLPVDVADAEAVFAAADRIVAEWGHIDVWVNCAMVTVYGFVRDMTAEEYRRVTEVTYLGCVHGTLAALRHMRRQHAGTIVQVGSALAYRAIPLQSAYCGAKFAARGFTDSLRSELIAEHSPVRLTMVHLPAVNTPQFDWARNHMAKRPQPVPPIFQPEGIARAIVRAAERAPRELWVGPSTLQAILGNMVAPGLLDRLLARTALRGQKDEARALFGHPDNLHVPVRGDYGAHGRFDDEAHTHVGSLRPTAVRGLLAALAAGVAVAGIAAYATRRRHATGTGRAVARTARRATEFASRAPAPLRHLLPALAAAMLRRQAARRE